VHVCELWPCLYAPALSFPAHAGAIGLHAACLSDCVISDALSRHIGILVACEQRRLPCTAIKVVHLYFALSCAPKALAGRTGQPPGIWAMLPCCSVVCAYVRVYASVHVRTMGVCACAYKVYVYMGACACERLRSMQAHTGPPQSCAIIIIANHFCKNERIDCATVCTKCPPIGYFARIGTLGMAIALRMSCKRKPTHAEAITRACNKRALSDRGKKRRSEMKATIDGKRYDSDKC